MKTSLNSFLSAALIATRYGQAIEIAKNTGRNKVKIATIYENGTYDMHPANNLYIGNIIELADFIAWCHENFETFLK